MPDVPKHAWTHRPRSQGGTDPIVVDSGASTPNDSVFGEAFSRSVAGVGTFHLMFDDVWTNNPGTMGYSQVTSSRAEYVTISEEGFYRYKGYVAWDSDFTTDVAIVPTCFLFGSPDVLTSALTSPFWDDTQRFIGAEQFATSEFDHHQLTATIDFNYLQADYGNPLGLGCRIDFTGTITKSWFGNVSVTRLGPPLESLGPIT